jgi:cell division inhibitor SulA
MSAIAVQTLGLDSATGHAAQSRTDKHAESRTNNPASQPSHKRTDLDALIDKQIARHVWRGHRIDHAGAPAGIASGFARLDAELPGGGWPAGALTELICREAGLGELRLLVPLMRQVTRAGRSLILLAPPHIPYAPALAAFGIDLQRLVIVQARQATDRLWAVEQALRSAEFGALLAWLPQQAARPDHLRRLQLAAQGAQGPVFLFRPLSAQLEPSPAPLRLLLLPRPEQSLSVQVLKRRGPVMGAALQIALPQPVTAIRLKSAAPRPLPAERTLASVHAGHTQALEQPKPGAVLN